MAGETVKSANQPQPPGNPKDPITLMRAMGLPVVPGSEYLSDTPIRSKPPSLEEIQRRLSKIKGSLSDEIRRQRDAL